MKLTAKQFIKSWQTKGQQRGGLYFLKPGVALKLLEQAQTDGYRLLGIDGFFLAEAHTQPSMEHSVDYSEFELGSATPYLLASRFLKEKEDMGLDFELVLADL